MKITAPTLVVDESRVRSNIKRFYEKATKSGCELTPHFKTHQSLQIGAWFKDYGVSEITVSSLSMAAYFSTQWSKIIVAFPINLKEIDRINHLASKIQLTLIAEDLRVLRTLDSLLKYPIKVLIDVDTGYNRTGVGYNNEAPMRLLYDCITNSKAIDFRGFYSHSGHSYHLKGSATLNALFNRSVEYLVALKQRWQSNNIHPEILYGDTPSCATAKNFNNIDAVSAGNYVFYDVTQSQIQSCTLEDIAVAVLCPIVLKRGNNRVVIYGGGVHFSKETLNGAYGKVVKWNGDSWDSTAVLGTLISISQEHGIVELNTSYYEGLKPGDVVAILPIHSCMTADCLRAYRSTTGEKLDHFEFKANP